MENKEELLPCPFCGSPAEFDFEDFNPDDGSGDDGMGWARCTNYKCGAEIFNDWMSATEQWNKRV